MGNQTNKKFKHKSIDSGLSAEEITELTDLYNSYCVNGHFDIDKFNKDYFFGKAQIENYIKKVYEYKKESYKQFSLDEFLYFCYILTAISTNSDEQFNVYYHKNTFWILYDIVQGDLYSLQNETNTKAILDVFELGIQLYIDQIKKEIKKDINLPYDKKSLRDFIDENIVKGDNSFDEVNSRMELKLCNIGPFFQIHYKKKLISNISKYKYLNTLPILTDSSSIVEIDKFYLYLLSNSLIFSSKYAFKLFDCSKNGYNIPSLIYSFLGFGGPVVIFIQHMDKNSKVETILGAYITNFKECYEGYCGDDQTYIFSLIPKLQRWRVSSSDDKILYINYKNQKFLNRVPGIGFGYDNKRHKLWIDANDVFNESYYRKVDDIFEAGGPFEDLEQKLNVINIEVYGFGEEEAMTALMKKQSRDKDISDKMKKIDKAHFATNEFDKEMFLSNTFSHAKYGHENIG